MSAPLALRLPFSPVPITAQTLAVLLTGALLGPTGGYPVGFVAAAYVTGMLAERGWDRRVGTVVLAMLFGNLVLYGPGLFWLARFVGPDKALALGLYPFIAGDLLKLAVAALMLPLGWKLLPKAETRRYPRLP